MKSFLFILWLGLGGFVAWQFLSHRSELIAANHRVEELTDELEIVKFELTKMAKLPVVEELPSRSLLPQVADETSEDSIPAKITAAAVIRSNRLKELERIYEDRRRKLGDSKTLLTLNLSAASSQYRTLQETPPTFDEQGSRYGWTGNRLGAIGVRTSNSDRDRELTKHNEKIFETASRIALIEAEIVKADAELERLERSYSDAVAHAEAAAKQ